MEFRVVAPDEPEMREGTVALAEVFGMDVDGLPPDAPEPARPDRAPSRFHDRPR